MEKKTKSKRANGEGTYYQLADKTWVHQICLGTKPNGRPDRKSFAGRTRAICNERKKEYLAEKARLESEKEAQKADHASGRRNGHSVESEITFAEAFPLWLNLYKSPPTKKVTTFATYQDIYRVHFQEAFGDLPLYCVTQDMVQDYYLKKQKIGARKDTKAGGLSPKTIRNHHMLLKDFFSYAQIKYKLDQNPTLETDRPEVQKHIMRVLDTEEMTVFMKEVMRETQRVAILFDLFTGLRRGELLALEISDLDMKTQSFHVQRNITRVRTDAIDFDNPNIRVLDYKPDKKTQLIIQNTPKSKTSNRIVPMSDGLCELVVRHLFTLEHSSWPNPENLLFPSTTGTHLDPKSYEIRLKAVSKRCEIKNVNPHALRHTFATRLVEENVPLTIIRDILGHASVTTTQMYTHQNRELERDAITGMTAYLNFDELNKAAALNGAKKRMKFADVELPDFSRRR